MQYICRTDHPDDFGLCTRCHVDMTPELVALIERRFAIAKQAHESDPSLCEMIFFDDHCSWFAYPNPSLEVTEQEKLLICLVETYEWVEAPDFNVEETLYSYDPEDFEPSDEKGYVVPTTEHDGTDYMVINAVGLVQFKTLLGEGVTIESCGFSISELRK